MLLSTYGSRGDVEPIVALAVELQLRGAQVTVCAPPDFAERLGAAGVPMVPVYQSASALTTAAPPPSTLPERAAAVIASQFETITAAAKGCDAMVVTGMMPAAAGALSVAEKLGIRAVSVTFQQVTLPSPDRKPLAYPGRPFPPDVTDNRVLWDLDAASIDSLFADALNRPAPTFESLSAALGQALQTATRVRAGAVAGTIRTDGAAVAAEQVMSA
ncbi:glycosyl transferase family protein [Actinoplanes friuliensis DSM 7358]|uniref:Glycosyl transferase family protein n=1 Tax=Actinoplanes friuliensis DSM 7358 TaxID=1246995 RepID=U5W4N0_9ACTN|nr:glycosyl transferase family protein [Actinoplanes friuliensis DSM 7358]